MNTTQTPYQHFILEQMSKSTDAMNAVVWQSITGSLGVMQLLQIEGNNRPDILRLDREFGIDFIGRHAKDEFSWYSTRVQFGAVHDTLTLRLSAASQRATEVEKRASQFAPGEYLEPVRDHYFTCHAYVNEPGTSVNQVFVAKTYDLIKYIVDGKPFTTNQAKGNVFAVLNVADLRAHGVEVREWKFNDPRAQTLAAFRESLARAKAKLSSR